MISEIENKYMKAHSLYNALLNSNASETEITNARKTLDELGDKVNEEYEKLNKSIKNLADKRVKSFYISSEGNIDEIKNFSNIWSMKDIFAEKINDDIKFKNITIVPIDLEDVLRSLLNFESIYLKRIDFDI